MFARNVSANLKPGTLAEFTKTMENEIVPWLRKQKGFLDAITLAVPGGREVVAISFWDQKENARLTIQRVISNPEATGLVPGCPQPARKHMASAWSWAAHHRSRRSAHSADCHLCRAGHFLDGRHPGLSRSLHAHFGFEA